jgi:tetratricopeptide (TPR) repeat protein
MKLMAAYVLRARTRPTFEEARELMRICLAELASSADSLPEPLVPSSEVKICVSNLMQSGDVEELLPDYVRDSGDGQYLDTPEKYRVIDFSGNTGSENEPTAIALAFSLHNAGAVRDRNSASAGEYLARGRRWEALGRTGDAFHCYFIGLDLAPDDPQLLLGLAGVELELERPVYAYEHALRAVALSPDSAASALVFARCCLKCLESQVTVEGGGTREDLYRFALTSVQRARVLDPENEEAASLLKNLAPGNETDQVLGFFN